MNRRLRASFLAFIFAGCAAVGVRTEGVSGPIAWHVTDLRKDEDGKYSFTLVLQETKGVRITFNHGKWIVYQPDTEPWSDERTGRWVLPAHGELRLPFWVGPYGCPPIFGGNCFRLAVNAPLWHIVFDGNDEHGLPIQIAVDIALPPDPSSTKTVRTKATTATPPPSVVARKSPIPLSPSAERPTFEVGDRWVRSDGELTVVRKDDKGYVLHLGLDKTYDVTPDGHLRAIFVRGTTFVRYEPPFPLFVWPLKVGSSWTYSGFLTNRRTRFEGPVQDVIQVEAYEEVRVPAGVFLAFRISGKFFTYWYSPEPKTIVKHVPKREGAGLEHFELVESRSRDPRILSEERARLERERQRLDEERKRLARERAEVEWKKAEAERELEERRQAEAERRRKPEPKLKAQGSGFLLKHSALILTAAHVVDTGGTIVVRFPDGITGRAKLLSKDVRNDLALLRLQDYSPSAAGFCVDPLVPLLPGQQVYVLGYPFGAVLSRRPSIVPGIVSAAAGVGDDPTRFRMTAPLNPGNSGGPIVNNRGEVVGVAVSRGQPDVLESTSFGIKVNAVLPILDQTKYKMGPALKELSSKTPVQLFEKYSPFVVLILMTETSVYAPY